MESTMRKLALAATVTLAITVANPIAGHANIIADFGLNPTAAQGAFNHAPTAGAFEDQYTFQLDRDLSLTIASVTNVYPNSTDFITGFAGAVFNAGADGVPGGGDDSISFGPIGASPCGLLCQGLSGAAILAPGRYYFQVSGTADQTSGYGGNLSTAPAPGPIAGAGLPGLLAAFLTLVGLNRRRKRRGLT